MEFFMDYINIKIVLRKKPAGVHILVREYEKSLSMVKAKPPMSYHLILIQYIFYHMIPFLRDRTVKI